MLIDTEQIRIGVIEEYAAKKISLSEFRFILRTIDAFEVLFAEIGKRAKQEGDV